MERERAFARRTMTVGVLVWVIIQSAVICTGQTKAKPIFEVRDLVDSTSAVKHILKDREGEQVFVGDSVFFRRADLQGVTAGKNPEGEGGVLNFTWKPGCVDRWKEYTGSRVGKRIAIIANDVVLATPKILDRIENPGIMLSFPDMDLRKAKKLAAELSPGKH